MDKSYIFLKSPIGSGGEANIYTVRIRPELVAKVYHQPHGDYARKLAFMVANPPVDPLASSGRVSIAWATELVTDLGLVVGFLMPKLDTSKAKPIFQYYNPSERRKESPTFSYVSLMRTARNLARAVRSVHSRGYVIGDVNESNVLVAEDAIVTLVDTDSFQVNDGTTIYRCTVGKPEYTPPELQGMSFRDVDRSVEHDLFGLGVLIYQLLMEGTHPFGGVFTGQGEAPELKDRIKSGHFPHGRRRVPYKPMPLAPSFQMLPVALQELFLLCFEVGHGNPAARPTAEVWSKALGEAEDGLVTCGVNGQHYYSGHLGVCPWCERTVKLKGRDPFPALGAINSGQHLKPAVMVIQTFKGHSSAVTGVVFSPDGKMIATGSHDSTVKLWNLDGKEIKTLAGHSYGVTSVAFSPDGKTIVTGSFDSTAKLWNLYGKEIKTLIGHSEGLFSVAFSPDGKTIAIGGYDGIKLWNLDGKEIKTFIGHNSNANSVAFSPDGKIIAIGSADKTAKLWKIHDK